ncbi:MAG TPA: glycosyltransferase [Burkholderiales bacterium]|nr:glycosyltransferase [Burkholderiales bacterium]
MNPDRVMKISVVVPAFNEERLLAASLRCLHVAMAVFARRGWAAELIVCDNNSTDRTAEIARAAGARVVFEPVNQISRARNAGAAHAQGDWLIFVDADSYPSPALCEDVAREIQSGRCLAGASTLRIESDRALVRSLGLLWNALSRINKWGAGAFIFCEASAFKRLGGFSQELYAAEEIDLFRRLKRLARRGGRTIAILHRHPLATSGRKARLYSARELLTFAAKTVASGGRTLRNPRECFSWYDGRR